MSQIDTTAAMSQAIPLLSNLYTHTHRYYEAIIKKTTWMNRKVVLLTSLLPKPATFVVLNIWRSTPYIAAELFLPFSFYLIGVIAVVVHKIIHTPPDKSPKLASVGVGIGFSQIVSGMGSILIDTSARNPFPFFKGVSLILIGGAFLHSSGFIKRFLNTK